MIKHQGGCHCGKVRFQTEFDPLLVYQCNCQRCRRMGGTVSVFTVYGKEELEINGHIHEFVTSGGSGLPVHYFSCVNCATRVYITPEFLDGFQLIPLGTFDDSLQFEPKMEIFTNYKVTWIRDNGCLKESFEESAVIERIGAMMENLDQRE